MEQSAAANSSGIGGYNSRTRVLHVNKIALVPETLVREARMEGKMWALRPIPPGRGAAMTVLRSRLQDYVQWRKVAPTADIVHVHYATNGYYGWGNKQFVLHVHGSDIRKDWQSPVLRPMITHSLATADAVICATADLLEWVQNIRSDALWVPNPVPEEFLRPHLKQPREKRIVFSSRWDSTKGVELLVPLARELIARGYEVVGLDWGADKDQAAEIGVRLVPRMDPTRFSSFLASAQLVVGQLQYPVLSMTDYQTMALNRPLVGAANSEDAPMIVVHTGEFSGLRRDPAVIADAIDEQLAQESETTAREWVLERHSPRVCVAQIEQIYSQLLG
ncbi:MAG: glycosyltransferase [Arcanobacterium sp.]|nr:glycosyltransferase [Arcanobacterium sp.]MDY5589226.1 glycosyltransferase family 4 protein [Arcanobacterium sp.]